MPFDFLQKNELGKRKASEVYKQAQELYEAYVWDAANLRSGQFGGDYIKLSQVEATTVSAGSSIAGTQVRKINTEAADTGNHCDIAYALAYDAQTVNFTVSTDSTPITLTGGTSGATGKLVADEDAGATGTLYVVTITGTFADNETITDGVGGSATSNIPSGVIGQGFYLASGTYQVDISTPAFRTDAHQACLVNINDSIEYAGTSESAANTDITQTRSFIKDEFTISASKTYKINHYTTTAHAGSGLGTGSASGKDETYTIVILHKVK